MKKIEIVRNNLLQNLFSFACPICGGAFHIEKYSLICEADHTFDIAKKGYINFSSSAGTGRLYNSDLFYERKKVSEFGFFSPLYEAVAKGIKDCSTGGGIMLDAGCGEGSALKALLELSDKIYTGMGIDLSKEAIRMAENSDGMFLFAGDLAHLPLRDKAAAVIVNILSPANYREFSRVLEDGILIKVIPGEAYLRQFREISDSLSKDYTNEKTVLHFKKSFEIIGEYRCVYDFPLEPWQLESILKMTPLLHNNEDGKEKILRSGIKSLSCDFSILIGRKLCQWYIR